MTDKEILLKASEIIEKQKDDDCFSISNRVWKLAQDLSEEPEPVRLPDGNIENFMPKVNGKPFRCSCGCNVFHKHDRNHPERYTCNACMELYTSE